MDSELHDNVIEHLTEFLKHYPRDKFAEESGTGKKTISRFLKGQKVSNKSLYGIYSALYGDKRIEMLELQVRKEPDNPIFRDQLNFFKTQGITENFDTSTMIDWEESNPHFRVMNLLCHSHGVRESFIERKFGTTALEILETLWAKDLLEKLESGYIRLKNYRFGAYNGQSARSFLLMTVSCYQPETFGTKDSQLTHTFGRVSDKGFTVMKGILARATLELTQAEKDHPGNIPFSLGTVMIKIVDDVNPDLN